MNPFVATIGALLAVGLASFIESKGLHALPSLFRMILQHIFYLLLMSLFWLLVSIAIASAGLFTALKSMEYSEHVFLRSGGALASVLDDTADYIRQCVENKVLTAQPTAAPMPASRIQVQAQTHLSEQGPGLSPSAEKPCHANVCLRCEERNRASYTWMKPMPPPKPWYADFVPIARKQYIAAERGRSPWAGRATQAELDRPQDVSASVLTTPNPMGTISHTATEVSNSLARFDCNTFPVNDELATATDNEDNHDSYEEAWEEHQAHDAQIPAGEPEIIDIQEEAFESYVPSTTISQLQNHKFHITETPKEEPSSTLAPDAGKAEPDLLVFAAPNEHSLNLDNAEAPILEASSIIVQEVQRPASVVSAHGPTDEEDLDLMAYEKKFPAQSVLAGLDPNDTGASEVRERNRKIALRRLAKEKAAAEHKIQAAQLAAEQEARVAERDDAEEADQDVAQFLAFFDDDTMEDDNGDDQNHGAPEPISIEMASQEMEVDPSVGDIMALDALSLSDSADLMSMDYTFQRENLLNLAPTSQTVTEPFSFIDTAEYMDISWDPTEFVQNEWQLGWQSAQFANPQGQATAAQPSVVTSQGPVNSEEAASGDAWNTALDEWIDRMGKLSQMDSVHGQDVSTGTAATTTATADPSAPNGGDLGAIVPVSAYEAQPDMPQSVDQDHLIQPTVAAKPEVLVQVAVVPEVSTVRPVLHVDPTLGFVLPSWEEQVKLHELARDAPGVSDSPVESEAPVFTEAERLSMIRKEHEQLNAIAAKEEQEQGQTPKRKSDDESTAPPSDTSETPERKKAVPRKRIARIAPESDRTPVAEKLDVAKEPVRAPFLEAMGGGGSEITSDIYELVDQVVVLFKNDPARPRYLEGISRWIKDKWEDFPQDMAGLTDLVNKSEDYNVLLEGCQYALKKLPRVWPPQLKVDNSHGKCLVMFWKLQLHAPHDERNIQTQYETLCRIWSQSFIEWITDGDNQVQLKTAMCVLKPLLEDFFDAKQQMEPLKEFCQKHTEQFDTDHFNEIGRAFFKTFVTTRLAWKGKANEALARNEFEVEEARSNVEAWVSKVCRWIKEEGTYSKWKSAKKPKVDAQT